MRTSFVARIISNSFNRPLLNTKYVHTSARLASDKPPSDPGWFSKLLGQQNNIEPMSSSHSTMLSGKDYVYELSTHDVNPAAFDDYLTHYGEYVKLIGKKDGSAELVGSWTVAVGSQDQAVHLWRYKDYKGADRALDALVNDQEIRTMNREQAKMCKNRKNCLILAFSFWGDPKPRPPKHIYELRSYILRAGTMIEWGNNWAKGINHRRDFSQDVGGFFSQIGRLYMVFHFWAYDSLSSRKQIREETWQKPGWDRNVAYTVPLIRKMESKILIPTKFSPLQ